MQGADIISCFLEQKKQRHEFQRQPQHISDVYKTILSCERWIDQHDTSVGQRKLKKSESLTGNKPMTSRWHSQLRRSSGNTPLWYFIPMFTNRRLHAVMANHVCMEMPTSITTIATCIARVTLKMVNYTLLVNYLCFGRILGGPVQFSGLHWKWLTT